MSFNAMNPGEVHPDRKDTLMRHSDATGVVGVGLLMAGLILFKLFDRWYHGVLGPLFWMIGCVLMITWAMGLVGRCLQRYGKDHLEEEFPTHLSSRYLSHESRSTCFKGAWSLY